MLKFIIQKVIGTRNQRELRKMRPIVAKINAFEEEYQKLPDAAVRAKTDEFKKRLQDGETTDDIMCEAFAVVKNVCRRLWGKKWDVCEHEITWEMIPFDVQLVGAVVLYRGKIAEMATGEGKTLVATMPLYLNALTGNNVSLVTVNDYLAKRDSQWMGKIYEFLGLTVGCIQNQMRPEERKQQYACDITYGTNSEFGFDYLRDNGMALSKQEQVQRGHYYAIIDEVDSILIDEARTPLIISGPVAHTAHRYDNLKPLVERLFKRQSELCGRFIKEARDLLERKDEGDNRDQAGIRLYQVLKGAPKNRQLLKMLEDPATRKLADKVELEMSSDVHKEEAHTLREQLFFVMDEKARDIDLTEKGREEISPGAPEEFIIPDIITRFQEIDEDTSLPPDERDRKKERLQADYEDKTEKIHDLSQLLRAFSLFEKDVDYVVNQDRVIIVDEYTGRLMPGRRYSDGLHQALEAKEHVRIEQESQTFATITIQNYFRMYKKLAGMTGTAETEANEFYQIYKLEVMVIPTNAPVRRIDMNDRIYKTRREKLNAVVEEIAQSHANQRPVLVGTITVETSELLSRLLKRQGIPHAVLNAKYHEQEAEIIVRAGQPGTVTIATNMAGRGTDIKLGRGVVKCNTCVIKGPGDVVPVPKECTREICLRTPPCGLHIIGTERHESRRIDRQLRGRSARQGDPGSSRFYISLEDDLMRLFGSDRIARIMDKIGLEDGQELEHPLLNRSIETAQKRVEQRNFSIRKHTLQYDDVMNKQREIIYHERNHILETEDPRKDVLDMIEELLDEQLDVFLPGTGQHREEWNIEGLVRWMRETFYAAPKEDQLTAKGADKDAVRAVCLKGIHDCYALKENFEGPDSMRLLERGVMLNTIDRLWREHLYSMDSLRHDIYLRAYGQRDPLIEYKQEGFGMFSELMGAVKQDTISALFRLSTKRVDIKELLTLVPAQMLRDNISEFDMATLGVSRQQEAPKEAAALVGTGGAPGRRPQQQTFKRAEKKVGRNEPCPCGSGKKYKKCCGST